MRFLDLHIHGAGRHDTRGGESAIMALAEAAGSAGVWGILPAVYPGPLREMRAALGATREAASSAAKKGRARVLGAYLEGPFLNPSKCGALDAGSFMRPTLSNLKRVVGGFEDVVKIITVAPEMPGALRLIERCATLGIRVSMGHSEATYRQALEGKRAGATGVTHVFNAMRPFHHREPGLAGLALTDRDLYVEVIPDGVHVHPGTLKMVFASKPPERIILVSDSVKGPMKKKGVLQGGGSMLTGLVEFLRCLGVSDANIGKAVWANPRRFLLL